MEPDDEDLRQAAGLSTTLPSLHLLLSSLHQESFESVQRLSPSVLAYLGDAVYELYVRASYLHPPKRLRDYHSQVVAHVRAESQAQHLQSLQPYLTSDELEVLRRGRNAVVRKPKRLSAQVYQQATSLETLLGYLYLTNPQRLLQLLMQIDLVDLPPDPRLEGECLEQSISEVEGC